MSSDTGLIARPAGNTGIITAESAAGMLDFSERMGKVFWKAGVGGCKTESDGAVLALACVMRGVDPFELTARHHIIGGKLAKKADVMLADFNVKGGKHVWLADGNDGVSASLELTSKDGQKIVSTFTFADATQQGLTKEGTRWKKGPKAVGSMLRARCVSEGVRMLDPSVAAGVYTPEELEDADTPVETAETPRKRRTKEELAARAEEIKAGTASTPTPAAANETREPGDEPVDAEFTSTDTEEAPFAVPERPQEPEPVKPVEAPKPTPTAAPTHPVATNTAANSLTLVLMEIEEVIRLMGATKDALLISMKQKNPAWTSLEVLTEPEARAILGTLRDAHAKQTAGK